MISKACMITGHRSISPGKAGEVLFALRMELFRAIDQGYTRFLSGFAQGADLLFAETVIQLKEQFPYITLEAAIPHPGRLQSPDPLFQKLVAASDVVKVHSQTYGKKCYTKRNRYMVDQVQRVIGLYDGRESGGTAATLRYAEKQGKEIIRIKV